MATRTVQGFTSIGQLTNAIMDRLSEQRDRENKIEEDSENGNFRKDFLSRDGGHDDGRGFLRRSPVGRVVVTLGGMCIV